MDDQRHSVDTDRHKTQITRLAVDIGLVSAYTSFVAVEDIISRQSHDPWAPVQVASLLPAGSQMQPIMLPAGAAGTDTLRWLSLLLALLAGMCWWFAQRLQPPERPHAF